ncbi:hypothetical protein [Melghirimyces algeriensis]|nr:hypothetical protein [Melghirimyces algeriensis]
MEHPFPTTQRNPWRKEMWKRISPLHHFVMNLRGMLLLLFAIMK